MLRKLLHIIILLGIVPVLGQEQKLATDYFREGSYEKAANLYEKIYKENPHNSYYLRYLIKSYQGMQAYKKTDSLIKKQLNTSAKYSFLWVELGYNYTLQHLEDKAEECYKKATEILEKKPASGYQIAKSFQDNHLLDYALQAYLTMMEKLPNANYRYQLAAIYGEKGNIEKMFDTYLDMIAIRGGTLTNVQRFIGKYITNDAQDNNNKIFKKLLIKRLQNNPRDDWNKLLSWIYLQQQDYSKALTQEIAVFKRNEEDLTGVIEVGAMAFDAADFSTARKAFDYIINNTSDIETKIHAHYYLLESQRSLEKDKKIINNAYLEVLKQYGKYPEVVKLQVSYANFLTFDTNQPQKAIEVLNNVLKNKRLTRFRKAEIQIKLADILVYTGNYNRALINYSQVQLDLKSHKLAQLARYKVAQTSYFKGDFEWANIQLKVLKKGTANLISNDAIALSLLIDDNIAQDSIPTALQKYAAADLLSYQNKNQAAIDTLSLVLKNFKGHPIEDEALYKRAELYEKTNNYEAAVQDYLAIIALGNEDILIDDALYQTAKLYDEFLDNPEKAKEYYEKIIFDHPSSIYLVPARKRFRQLRGDTVIP